MGQYHILANLSNGEYVDPHSLGMGAKQYEHTLFAGDIAHAMYLLTMTSVARGGGDWPNIEGVSGRWAGDRVVVLGDYTEDSDIPDIPNLGSKYGWFLDEGTNISEQVGEALRAVVEPVKGFTPRFDILTI
jgi:hypothetical protein